MDTFILPARSWLRRLALLPALLLGFSAGSALAQQQADVDPPGRVATLTHQVGSVVFAPSGEEEWIDLPLNRPLTRGDRVWTDAGARAELHMGTGSIHLDSQTQLAFFELDDRSAQLSVTQGTVNLRVRDLAARENVEIDTPNLAVRATQPGDYRVDIDTAHDSTRVYVRSGEVQVFGQGGETTRLSAGQQEVFEGRGLARSTARYAMNDDFDRWSSDLIRREDASVTARYVPRDVVGYYELDNYGTWSSDANYGNVWYPTTVANDWAPYRYGQWAWIAPWGWTWVDQQPWGFAPFHYGRWAMIGARWAWVPGSLGPRPYYAPALVGFLGGSGFNISIGLGSGPGIGWYPLAPGELWYPSYRVTNVYVTHVNRNMNGQRGRDHFFRTQPNAVTAMRVDDFNHGRPVHDHFRPLRPNELTHLTHQTTLPQPDRSARVGGPGTRQPRLTATPPSVNVNTGIVPFGPARRELRDERREVREDRRDNRREERAVETRRPPMDNGAQQRVQQERFQRDQAVREQQRNQQERVQQERAQREQERAVREQQQQQRAQQEQRSQREQQQRVMQEREQAVRQQQEQRAAQREQFQRAQQERAQRQQEAQVERQQRVQQQRERPQREQRDDDDQPQRGRGHGRNG